MGERQRLGLVLDRLDHVGIRMAEATDGGTTRSVEITLSVGIDDVNAIAFFGARQIGMDLTVKHV